MSDEQEERRYILKHPEVEEVLETVSSTIVAESDRGAVLVGADIVDSHLDRLFRQAGGERTSSTLLRKVLSYPGPLSTFSAKADVAFLVGLIDKREHKSINILRRIRNDAAHSAENFKLSDHRERLIEMLKLGSNLPYGISKMSSEILVRDVVEKAWESEKERIEKGEEPLFESRQEIFEHIIESSDVADILEEKHSRLVLGFGVALVCGLIVYKRENRLE